MALVVLCFPFVVLSLSSFASPFRYLPKFNSMKQIKTFRFPSLFLASLLLCSPFLVAQVTSLSDEAELIAILQSDGPPADKAMACKRLAIYGSEKCVLDVGKLLKDEQLSSWARITLEAIPGKASNQVLRTESESVKGRLLVGILNSIGVRRDVESVDLLSKYVMDSDTSVASAAAVALGRIGNPASTEVLKQSIAKVGDDVRSAVAEGLVLSAERSMLEGKLSTAMEVYDLVRGSKVAQQRVVEATRGAILCRKTAGIPLLLEELRATEYFRFQLGLGVARELDGREVDQALAAELASAPADRAALILVAMADRPATVDVPAIMKAASSEAKSVRLAALKALGSVGNVACVSTLLNATKDADKELTDTVVVALSQISDAKVDGELAKRMNEANGSVLVVLIRALGERGVPASDGMIKALENADVAVRTAAFTALGDTLPANRLSVLINQFLAPKYAIDQDAASGSLKTAAIRMPDREACANELTDALAKAKKADLKAKLIEILGAVGGTKALTTVGESALSSEEASKDSATKVLGNWMTIDAAPVLLSLSEKMPDDKYRVRAVKAYLRIARQFDMPLPQRVAMAESAITIVRQPEEKKLVLDVLKRNPSLEMLQLAVKLAESQDIKADAVAAANEIAGKIQNQPEKVQAILSKLPK